MFKSALTQNFYRKTIMAKIKKFSEFDEMDLLTDKSIKNLDKEIIMSLLYKSRNKEIGNKLHKIIDRFKKNEEWGDYDTPDDWFSGKEYKTFMQYFKRKLSKEKLAEIKQRKNLMSLPCECNIESVGKIGDVSDVIRLKKKADSVVRDLKSLGVKNINKLGFVNMKLLKVYYHRVHSPVTGKIKNIIEVSPDDNFFGDNNLWIVEIDTKDFGSVYMMLVGELSIQDFDFKIKKGDEVEMYDEIGNFNWASQVIILYNLDKFEKMKIKQGKKYFVGGAIF
jgi:phosphatidylserine decarboxylase